MVVSAGGSDPPGYLLIPIRSLLVPCEWQVGRVTFHPGNTADTLLADTPPADPTDGLSARRVAEVLFEARDGCFAQVRAPGIKEALPLAENALAALRVFQYRRADVQPLEFGLSWDIGTHVRLLGRVGSSSSG